MGGTSQSKIGWFEGIVVGDHRGSLMLRLHGTITALINPLGVGDG